MNVSFSYRAVVSKTKLSGDEWTSVTWEVTWKDGDDFWPNVTIGYVDGKAVDSVRLYDNYIGDRPQECALGILSDGFYKLGEGNGTMFDEKWKGLNCRIGDRIRFAFDFEARRCTVYYNDELVGILSEALPDDIYLACCCGYKGHLQTTKFQAVHR